MMKNDITNYWLHNPKSFTDSYRGKNSLLDLVHFYLHSRIRKAINLFENISLTDKKVLDVGCGEGQYLEYFLSKKSSVTGIDYSSKMLVLAKKYLLEKGFKKFSLVKANAKKLPFRNGSFDIVLAVGLLEYLSTPAKAVFEIGRVLRKNGYALLSFPKKWSPFFFLRIFPGTILRRKVFKLPELATTFDEWSVGKILTENKLRIISKITIMNTEWLILCRKIS